MTEAEMRAGIRDVLRSLNAVAEAAIRRELAEPIDLGHSERLQFEACRHFFGIKLVQTDEEIIPDSAVQDALPPELQAAAEMTDLDVFAGIEAELPPWLAERWQAVGGPSQRGTTWSSAAGAMCRRFGRERHEAQHPLKLMQPASAGIVKSGPFRAARLSGSVRRQNPKGSMYRPWIIVTSCILLPAVAVADDAGRAVVEQAIEAHGGAEKVAKLRVMRIKAEGAISLVPGQPGMPIVIEDWWQMPDQYKTTSHFEVGGKKVSQTQALDGEAGWINVGGRVQDLPKEAIAEMREQKYAEDLDRLGFLDDKGIEITAIGEAKVENRAAVGVLVQLKGHRDVKLYFDKESGRLVKREHTVFDGGTGKDVVQEVVFGDYRETDGVPHYHTLTAFRGAKKFVDAKVVEVEFFDKLDKKVFAKP